MSNEGWKHLIDVIFNDKQDVPIEFIAQFRHLAQIHHVEDYCDFLRGKELPQKLLESPWEWSFLEDLSKVLPPNIQVLVLKGAAARDMELYPIPGLRYSCDLDIFISEVERFEKQKEIIEYLVKENNIKPEEKWEINLKKFKTVMAKIENNYVDIHFDLFPLFFNKSTNLSLESKYKKLENGILKRALPFCGLTNISKMHCKDFWFYNIFHFLKDYPFIYISSILDSYLVLKSKKVSLEELKDHGEKSNQIFLYDIGLHLLGQLYEPLNKKSQATWIQQNIFQIHRIINPANYSIKNRLLSGFSKCSIATNGALILPSLYGVFNLIKNNLISTSIDEGFISFRSISNIINKILYTLAKFKSYLKLLCIKSAPSASPKITNQPQIIPSIKKLISVKIEDLKLTFNVPEEFLPDLKKIWEGFLTEDHLSKKIEVEKIRSETSLYTNLEMVYSNKNFYLKSNDFFGGADLSSSGNLYAKDFWDARTFALFLFRVMTFEREDLLLVHTGAVKIKNETLIFPGESSTGKTTFFNLLTKNGASGINDDTILLKKEGDTWFVYPTPFMSKFQEPIICEKQKLTGIIDLIKVCGGHEIKPIEIDHTLALLLSNSLGDITIDDAGFIKSIMAKKIIDLSEQVKFSAQIKYSLKDSEKLFELINKWLDKSKDSYRLGSDFIRLVAFRGVSMEPTFKHGDILQVEEVFPEKLKSKDVIGYKSNSNGFPTIHRIKYLIKHKNQTTIITKGDNSTYEDLPNVFKSNQKLLKIIGKYRN